MAQSVRMAVISDVHVMAPELLEKDGAAFEKYLRNDRKMLTESVSLAGKLCGRLLAQRPDVVLLTGDLTKDGEKVFYDHIEFNECCQKRTFDMLMASPA